LFHKTLLGCWQIGTRKDAIGSLTVRAHCFDPRIYVAFMSQGPTAAIRNSLKQGGQLRHGATWNGSLKIAETFDFVGDPSRIRTCNPRSRNPLLYPVELWDRNFRKPGLHSIANMKNPLSGQAPSEPFLAIRRQSSSGGPFPSDSQSKCSAAGC